MRAFYQTFRGTIAALILLSGLLLHAGVACAELCCDDTCGTCIQSSESHDHCDCEPQACAPLHTASFAGLSVDRIVNPDLSMTLSIPDFLTPPLRPDLPECMRASLPGEAKTVCAMRTGITVLRT